MKFSHCLLFITLLFGACQDNSIRILGEDSSNLQAIERLAIKYQDQTGVKIVVDALTFEESLQRADQDLALGSGNYDIILQYNFRLSRYVEGDLVWRLQDLKDKYPNVDTSFEKDLFEKAWKEVGYYYAADGTISPFAYPFAANTLLLVYNKELIENKKHMIAFKAKYGVDLVAPKTLDDMYRIVEYFGQSDGTFGIVLQGDANGWLYYEWATFLASEGVQLFTKNHGWERAEDERIDLNRTDIIQATKKYLSLKPYNGSNFEKTDATIQRDLMKNGNTAIAIMWSDYVPEFYNDAELKKSFGIMAMPGKNAPLGGGSFYINKKSKNSEESYKFLAWVLQPRQQEILLRDGLASPLESSYNTVVRKDMPYADALFNSLSKGQYAFEANIDAELVQLEITKALQDSWKTPATLEKNFTDAAMRIHKERLQLFGK